MAKSTVVIPNYNGIKYIEACLNSLYAGKTQDFELIFIDNASSDGSYELIQERFPQVTLIRNEKNEGFATAVNQGIALSKTQYVILLNNDTEVAPEFIQELEKVMDADEQLFSASAKMIALHDKTKMDDAGDFYCALGWAFAWGKGKNPQQYVEDYDIFASCAGAAIYRRACFEQVGLFDDNHFAYFEDIDIGYRAKLYGYENRFASKAVVYHAGSATSGSRYNTFKTKLASRNSVYLIYKNMPIWQIVLNSPFLFVGFAAKTLFFIKKGFGKDYVQGLWNGVKLAKSIEGQAHKVRVPKEYSKNYWKIQLALWKNITRLFS